MRGTNVLDPEFLTIGKAPDRVPLLARLQGGHRRSATTVTIASDVHILGGGHDFNDPDFLPIPIPTVIEDYVWIASRGDDAAVAHPPRRRRCGPGGGAPRTSLSWKSSAVSPPRSSPSEIPTP